MRRRSHMVLNSEWVKGIKVRFFCDLLHFHCNTMTMVEALCPIVPTEPNHVYSPHCLTQSTRSTKMNRGREVIRGKLWTKRPRTNKVCHLIHSNARLHLASPCSCKLLYYNVKNSS